MSKAQWETFYNDKLKGKAYNFTIGEPGVSGTMTFPGTEGMSYQFNAPYTNHEGRLDDATWDQKTLTLSGTLRGYSSDKSGDHQGTFPAKIVFDDATGRKFDVRLDAPHMGWARWAQATVKS